MKEKSQKGEFHQGWIVYIKLVILQLLLFVIRWQKLFLSCHKYSLLIFHYSNTKILNPPVMSILPNIVLDWNMAKKTVFGQLQFLYQRER